MQLETLVVHHGHHAWAARTAEAGAALTSLAIHHAMHAAAAMPVMPHAAPPALAVLILIGIVLGRLVLGLALRRRIGRIVFSKSHTTENGKGGSAHQQL